MTFALGYVGELEVAIFGTFAISYCLWALLNLWNAARG